MKISRFFIPFLFKVAIIIIIITTFYTTSLSAQNSSAVKVDVGVILDLKTESGKMRQTCISLALADFYGTRDHRTRIFPHFRDSNNDDVDAASAGNAMFKTSQFINDMF